MKRIYAMDLLSLLSACTERTTTIGTSESTSALDRGSAGEVAAGGDHCVKTSTGGVVCVNRRNGPGNRVLPSGHRLFVVPLEAKAVSLTASPFETCILLATGKVSCFRGGTYEELFPSTGNLPTVPGLDDATSLSTFGSRACAVRVGGSVSCWGYAPDSLGITADATCSYAPTGQTLPCATVQPVSTITNTDAVTIGKNFQCALHTGGTVSCWGNGELGTLGDDTTVTRGTPAVIAGLSNVAQLIATWNTVYALTNSGELYSWGSRKDGSTSCKATLTDGTKEAVRCETKPVLLHGPSAMTRISAAHDAWDNTATVRLCESDAAGKIRCSGGGSSFLVENLFFLDVISFATSDRATCSVLKNGEFGCWGRGYVREVPDGADLSTFTALDIAGL